jgi:uncharacterized membrane protein YhaH (DUF805 family)
MVGTVICPNCSSNVSTNNTSCWKCGTVMTSDQSVIIRKANGLRSLFGFDGRLNRGGFLLREAISLVSVLVGIFTLLTPNPELIWVFIALHYVITVCASVRRLHDAGQSGWVALLYVFPGAGYALLFMLAIRPGDGIPNDHGQAPVGFEVAL